MERHQATFLWDHDPDSFCPPLFSEKEKSFHGGRSQGMVLRFSHSIFHLFRGIPERGSWGYGMWFSDEISVSTADLLFYRRATRS